jgi:hypothetical protein
MSHSATRNDARSALCESNQARERGPDTLTAKRAAESRQLAIAAVNEQQKARVQQAVATFMGLAEPTTGRQQPSPTTEPARDASAGFR